ncbi:MAG: hypothetical protein UT05_C0015G0006 [Parcubacteria group bacterium GW2011_GWF2_38_76]|nr:MAG: hypothetical protein UT05_C0015G0006 [Parcubacteria group bacterium GW2011_GWF2_38_76]
MNQVFLEIMNAPEIVNAKYIDILTGKEYDLIPKEQGRGGVRCLFAEAIHSDNKEIRLRLDFKDLVAGDPILDANIFQINENDVLEEIPNDKKWHHTVKSVNKDSNLWQYDFRFEDFELQLQTKFTKQQNVSARAYIINNSYKK